MRLRRRSAHGPKLHNMMEAQTWLQEELAPSVMPVDVRMREYVADMDSKSTRFLKSCTAVARGLALCASIMHPMHHGCAEVVYCNASQRLVCIPGLQ